MSKFSRVYLGSASLDETCRACKTEQQDETAKLLSLEPALLKKNDGTETKVNIAQYEETGILNILDQLKCFDLSTASGTSDAAAAGGTFTQIFEGKIFVGNQLKLIRVVGKKSP